MTLQSLLRPITYPLARALLALPRRVQLALSGRPEVVIDGLTLDPQMQLLIALRDRVQGGSMAAASIAEARAKFTADLIDASGPPLVGVHSRDIEIPGPAGAIRARHYRSDERGGQPPLLVYAHGGGFVLGDIDSHDALCRILALHAGVHVVSIEYRLSPDHKLPAAIDDLQAALSWALANASALGADPARVGVGGDSAGGNLSAIVAWLGARDKSPAPRFQLLLYPAVDRSKPYPSLRLFDKGFLLSRADIDWFHEQHAKHSGLADDDPRVSPSCAPDLTGAAPAIVVTAGFDPLRDEGEAYAKALEAAGTPVTLRRFDGLVHGFANLAPISSSAREAVLEIAGCLRVLSRS